LLKYIIRTNINYILFYQKKIKMSSNDTNQMVVLFLPNNIIANVINYDNDYWMNMEKTTVSYKENKWIKYKEVINESFYVWWTKKEIVDVIVKWFINTTKKETLDEVISKITEYGLTQLDENEIKVFDDLEYDMEEEEKVYPRLISEDVVYNIDHMENLVSKS